MSTGAGTRRVLRDGPHPNEPDTTAAQSVYEDTLNDLIRIMTKVAAGDFSEKPPMCDDGDAVSRFCVAFRFLIDDLERAHLQRQSEIERLRELDQMKTRFINLAAHELNTPLTPIGIHLHLLRRRDQDRLTPAQNAAIEALDRNFERLGRSVGDLLDVARLQNKGLQIHPTPRDLSHLVRATAEEFRPTLEQKRIRFKVDCRVPLFAAIDQGRISQVLYNLFTNAYKFTPTGGRVAVAVRDDKEHVLVTVTDSGIGLDGDQMARLFRPFSQVHVEDDQVAEGTGLGLFISRGIIEAHDGRLWVDSEGKGRGARFSFLLPKPATTPPGRQNA